MYLQSIKMTRQKGCLALCLAMMLFGVFALSNHAIVYAERGKAPLAAEGMSNSGITIDKAEFCKERDKPSYGYKGIYGFVYLRLSGAPKDATYKITRCNAGYDHNNFWPVNMPPAHGFSWQIKYMEGETIDFDVYDRAGEKKLATFTNVPLRIIDCDKPVVPPLEANDHGAPTLVSCDYFAAGPVGSTSAEKPNTQEFANGYVYIRVKNIDNAAKFDVKYNKMTKEATNGEPATYTPTKSKHKGFIGVMPTAKVYKISYPVEIEVNDNSYEETPEQQKQKKEFPLTVYIYDKDDKLLHTFNNVYPRIVSKFNHITCPGNGTRGGLQVGQLQILLQETYSVNPSEYTQASMKKLVDLREEAEKLVKTKKGSQAQVNIITRKLFEARENLVPIGSGTTPTITWDFDKATKTLRRYNGEDTNITIPRAFDGVEVCHIGNEAFKDKGIDAVSMPTTIKSIGERAFEGNNLTRLNIPKWVHSINKAAFKDNRISELAFDPEGKITTIASEAFKSNALKDVTIPRAIKIIEDQAFAFNLFEDEMLKINASTKDVNFNPTALDKNTPNKNKRVNPKFLKGEGSNVPQDHFRMICVLESADQAESFTMSVINKETNKKYEPIEKKIVDRDGVELSFDIPAGVYSYKESPDFFVMCDCGKPKREEEKVFNFNGKAQIPLALGVRSWKNWKLVSFALPKQMAIQSSDPDDLEGSLRAIVHRDEKIKVEQLPKYKLDAKYEFVGWKLTDKMFSDDELTTTYTVTEDMELLAVIRQKETGRVIVAGKEGAPDKIILASPKVIANEDGSMIINPPKDRDIFNIIVKYQDNNGVEKSVVAFQNSEGKWILSTDIVGILIDKETGKLTILDDQVKDNSKVTAIVKDQQNNQSEPVEAIAKEKVFVLDKKPLEDKIAEAKKITQGNKTDEAFDALKKAIETAEANLKTVKTRKDVTKTIDSLSNAIQIFNRSKDKIKPNITPDYPTIKPQPPLDQTPGSHFNLPVNNVSSDNQKEKPVEKREDQKLETSTQYYSDTIGHWAKKAIDYVTRKGYFMGVGEGHFAPNKTITRADFVTVLGRMANVKQTNYTHNPFRDLSDTYYTGYVLWAQEKGIVKGMGDGKFDPTRAITREEMAVIMSKYLEVTGKTLNDKQSSPFKDEEKISSWAKEAVNMMAKKGIVKGMEDKTFGPQKGFTRAQVAQVLFNVDHD